MDFVPLVNSFVVFTCARVLITFAPLRVHIVVLIEAVELRIALILVHTTSISFTYVFYIYHATVVASCMCTRVLVLLHSLSWLGAGYSCCSINITCLCRTFWPLTRSPRSQTGRAVTRTSTWRLVTWCEEASCCAKHNSWVTTGLVEFAKSCSPLLVILFTCRFPARHVDTCMWNEHLFCYSKCITSYQYMYMCKLDIRAGLVYGVLYVKSLCSYVR